VPAQDDAVVLAVVSDDILEEESEFELELWLEML
jgi:hypothetical protein